MHKLAQTINRALVVGGVLALLIGLIFHFSGNAPLARAIWIAGAVPATVLALVSTVVRLARRDASVDAIALLAIGGAIALGEALTAIVIGLMFVSGRALEEYAQAKAKREMSALLERTPKTANRYAGSEVLSIPISQIASGDRLLVRSGEVVPVDGLVQSLLAVLDESALTGEFLPVRHPQGAAVRSGVLNAAGPFDLLATSSAANSTFADITRMAEAAQQAKAPFTRLADRYALLFLPLTILIAALAWGLSGDPVRALAVLVVATPCPLILAVPVALVSGLSRCASRGVLVKSGAVLNQLAEHSVLFFDKTGTLTAGQAHLSSIEATGAQSPDDLLRMAASLEQMSGHVLAQAVVSIARQRGLSMARPSDVREQHGAGIVGTVDGHRVAVGSQSFVTQAAAQTAWANDLSRRSRREGIAVVFVAMDGVISGALLLGDEIRVDTPRAIRRLRRAGVRRVVMLTGDRREAADAVGEALGVDEVCADQTPGDKLAAITAAKRAGSTIMVGDGINDAPALAAADVGVAMGTRGAAASSQAAGVVLLTDRLDRLAEALIIARRTKVIAIQSVMAGMGMSLIAMVVAASGYLAPVAGAILQEGIDATVILNALRVLRTNTSVHAERFETAEIRRLAAEHEELAPVLDRIRVCADQLPSLPEEAFHSALSELTQLLSSKLVPHERYDERELYPKLERMLGGDDPLAPLSRTHREILKLGRLFQHMAEDLPPGRPPPDVVQDLQRVLYGLEAILRLHFSQEEEIYHGVAETT